MTQPDDPGTSKGTAFGCLTALLILMAGGFLILLAGIVGDCEPDPRCQAAGNPAVVKLLVAVLVISALFGLVVGQLASLISRRMARFSKAGAMTINLLLTLLAAWLGYEVIINLPLG